MADSIKDIYAELATAGAKRHALGLVPTKIAMEVSDVRISYVDPETLLAIAKAIKFLVDLFNKDDYNPVQYELEKIGLWMQGIDEKLAHIETALQEIRDELRKLGLKIAESFRLDAEIETLGRIQTYVTNLPALRANPESPELRQFFLGIYADVQSAVRDLMQYGYVNVVTVFYGLRAEVDLARILKLPVIKTLARDHKIYYQEAVDLNFPGSIANGIQVRTLAMDALKREFSAGGKGWIAVPFFYKDNRRLEGNREGRQVAWDRWRVEFTYNIEGDIETGFRVGAVDRGGTYADSSRGDSDYSIGFDMALGSARKFLQDNVMPRYETGSGNYIQIRDEQRGLLDLQKYCEDFQAIAARLEANAH